MAAAPLSALTGLKTRTCKIAVIQSGTERDSVQTISIQDIQGLIMFMCGIL